MSGVKMPGKCHRLQRDDRGKRTAGEQSAEDEAAQLPDPRQLIADRTRCAGVSAGRRLARSAKAAASPG
jgi:hypothetical protein